MAFIAAYCFSNTEIRYSVVNKKLFAIVVAGLFVLGFTGLASNGAIPRTYATVEDMIAWCTGMPSEATVSGSTCTLTGSVTMSIDVRINIGETLNITTGSIYINPAVTLAVDSGGILAISGSVSTYVDINNQGIIINAGAINVENTTSVGIFNNAQGIITNDAVGIITISNTVCGSYVSGITNDNIFTNYGTINVENTASIGIMSDGFASSPGFINAGNITISKGGPCSQGIQNYYAIINSGTINVDNSAGTGVYNVAIITLTASGTINVENSGGRGIFNYVDPNSGATGAITNSGKINVNSTGYVGVENYGGFFTNAATGIITIRGGDVTISGNQYVFDNAGTMTNYGTINIYESGTCPTNDFCYGFQSVGTLINYGGINLESATSCSGGGSCYSFFNVIALFNVCGASINIGSSDLFYNIGTITNSGSLTGHISGTQPVQSTSCITEQGSSTVTISSGGASTDQTSTGISIVISGSLAADGTSVLINTEDLSSQEPGVSVSGLSSASYYDVQIFGITDGTATICITTSSTSGLTMQYWDGSAWVSASHITTSANQVCGNIPDSALTGTNIAIGQPFAVPTPEFPFGTLLAVFVPIAALALFVKQKEKSRGPAQRLAGRFRLDSEE